MANTRKATTPKLDDSQQAILDAVMEEFFTLAGWSSSSEEDRAKEFEAIDDKILQLEQQIEQLRLHKENFSKREQVAEADAAQMLLLLGPAADLGKKQVIETLCVKYNVAKPKARRQPRVPIAEEMLEQVADVLDHEGMTATEVKKSLPAGTQIEGPMLSKILLALIDKKRVGTHGDGRAKRYYLLGDGETEEEIVNE